MHTMLQYIMTVVCMQHQWWYYHSGMNTTCCCIYDENFESGTHMAYYLLIKPITYPPFSKYSCSTRAQSPACARAWHACGHGDSLSLLRCSIHYRIVIKLLVQYSTCIFRANKVIHIFIHQTIHISTGLGRILRLATRF